MFRLEAAIFVSIFGAASAVAADNRIELSLRGILEQPARVSLDDGTVCEAAILQTVQSRLPANEGHWEFWCRNPKERVNLRWERLPDPHAKLTKANIANFRGELVELQSGQLYRDGWQPISEALPELSGSPITWQTLPDGSLATYRYSDCGLVLSIAGVDVGLLPDRTSYAHIFGGRVVGMASVGLFSAKMPDTQVGCTPLDFDVLVEDAGQAYGGLEHEGAFIIGGSGYPENAPLYSISANGAVSRLTFESEGAAKVFEHYAYVRMGKMTLVGLYPSGGYLVLGNEDVLYTEALTPQMKGDYRWDDGLLYREAQAAVSTYGLFLTGLYPWGEIVLVDTITRDRDRTRLFSHPRRSGRLPYIFKSVDLLNAFQAGHFDEQISAGEITVGSDGLPDRLFGMFESAWGQRVSSIAVFPGKVCAATGSMGNTIYNPELHSFMTAEEAGEYGAVYCADLPNHRLFTTQPEPGDEIRIGDVTFVVAP